METADPFRAFDFELQVDDVALGGFSECTGLAAGGAAVDYREGTDLSPSIRKLAGLRKYAAVVLKRGYVQDQSLWAWYQSIVDGAPARRSVTIVVRNEERKPVLRWHADGVWLNKIEGPSFNASANEVAIESVELLHEGLTREEVDPGCL
jgi:phage tail-like protein